MNFGTIFFFEIEFVEQRKEMGDDLEQLPDIFKNTKIIFLTRKNFFKFKKSKIYEFVRFLCTELFPYKTSSFIRAFKEKLTLSCETKHISLKESIRENFLVNKAK